MNLDLINRLEKILESSSEWEKAQEESNEFIRDSRKRGTRAEDNKKLNDDIAEDSEDENIFDKAKKDLESEKEKEEEKKPEKVETPDESPSTINLSDAQEFKSLIKLLNQFRASRSLTDKDVYDNLNGFFEDLTREEKEVLHVFIKSMTQITLLDVDGETAYNPKKLGFEIKKTSTASSEKIKAMKNMQKSKEKAKELSNKPITIGSSIQEKADILNLIRRNNE